VVSFGIEGGRHLEHMPRTIGLAQLTALAASGDESDLSTRNNDLVMVKRGSPKFQVVPPG
jgi:hypothetical protein